MRIVLFCENKYAIDILYPIYKEALKEGGNETLLKCIYNENKDEPYVCRMEDVNVCNGDTKMEMEGEDKFCFCFGFCDFCCF